jgi:uncharacterized protein
MSMLSETGSKLQTCARREVRTMHDRAPTPASREFQVFAKPVGPICNLDCHYCYYLEKQHLYPERASFRMPDDLLEEYIVQTIEACPSRVIRFLWHGGEPTLLGLDYFRNVVALQRKHQPEGRRIVNGMQTNGTLLDEDWFRFLAVEGFVIGLSLDGPRALHDGYRVAKRGEPTHTQVMRAHRLLRRHRVPYDVLCVVHAQNVQHPIPVYRFFKEIKAESVAFLPLVESRPDLEGGVSEQTVPAEALGVFLCAVFDEWLRHDVGRIHVQFFDEAVRVAEGQEPAVCIFRETCGDVPVVEHDGAFFSCDHFVDAEHRLGNLRETRLVDMVESPGQRAFGQVKSETLPRYCRECEVRTLCNGGCPKDRILRTPDGEPGLNYLCAGLKRFFTHSRPWAEELAALRRARQPVERLGERVRAREAKAAPRVGRNDPCPCGSGRKFKRCCLDQ